MTDMRVLEAGAYYWVTWTIGDDVPFVAKFSRYTYDDGSSVTYPWDIIASDEGVKLDDLIVLGKVEQYALG